MADYGTQDLSHFWEPRKAFCLDEQMNKKPGLSSGGKDQCKPNPVARRGPSVVSRPSDSLARQRGESLHFSQEKTGKHEITSLNQQRLSSPENGKANHCRHSCTVNLERVSEHSSLPSHLSEGLGLNEAHSLWFIANNHKILVLMTTGKLKEIMPISLQWTKASQG